MKVPIFTYFDLECNSPKHVANGESYLIARLTFGTAKAERIYFTKTYDLGHSSSTFKQWICICICFSASNTYKQSVGAYKLYWVHRYGKLISKNSYLLELLFYTIYRENVNKNYTMITVIFILHFRHNRE